MKKRKKAKKYGKVIGYVLLAVLAGAAAFWGLRSDRPSFARSTATVETSAGKVVSFAIEVARSKDEQNYGLMHIHSLADDKGMVFIYDSPREVMFWMKNTFVPLDMLFILPDHRIGRVVTHAQPLDVTPIPSMMPVIAVLELKAGQAEANHIAVGDKVNSPVFQ